MVLRGAVVSVLWGVIAATPVVGQIAAPGPPGPYVIDLRAATSAVPADAAYLPPVPTGTRLPSRGYGVEVGAHVYALRLGPSRLGIGVGVLRVRGGASPASPSNSTSQPSASATTPGIDVGLTVIASQLSFNFGSAQGWSYLSAGVGRARVTSVASSFAGAGSVQVPPGKANTGMVSSANIGVGARWFAKRRLGVSFDVRAHMIGSRPAVSTGPSLPHATLMAASVGIAVR